MKKSYRIDMDCAGCVTKLEEAAKATAGVKDCIINFMAAKMHMVFEENQNIKEVMEEVYKNCKKVESDCEIYLK